jgi:D-serine deaminase-like pyridoxal phosphate-dependent protein
VTDPVHARLAAAIAGRPLPLALVDLDALERNAEHLIAPTRAAGKTLRLATKSVRCRALVRRLLDRAPDVMRGLMCYSVGEAAHLAASGFDDLLVAYPSAQAAEAEQLAALTAEGRRVSIVADAVEQLALLERAAVARGVKLSVLVDADLGSRPGGGLHLGVRRSPLRSVDAVLALARRVHGSAPLRLAGVMAYDAQVAGLGDVDPAAPALTPVRRWVKGRFRRGVETRRAAIAAAFRAEGLPLTVFNGAGSGSLHTSCREPDLTEVTAGSGFLGSHLFDHYDRLAPEPALFFALPVVRHPEPGLVTCFGGGYVASGEAGASRLPQPWSPAGLRLLDLEGAGEVQTPVRLGGGPALPLGSPVFFRPAKAGELAERFSRYLLLRGDRVEDEVPTYRGDGVAFG